MDSFGEIPALYSLDGYARKAIFASITRYMKGRFSALNRAGNPRNNSRGVGGRWSSFIRESFVVT